TPAVTYDTIESIHLNPGTCHDIINVASTTASAQSIVNADGGTDSITITTTGANSLNIFDGGDGNDTFVLNGTGAGGFTQLNGQSSEERRVGPDCASNRQPEHKV